jgi:PTS system nitrogen regulatory IIA component
MSLVAKLLPSANVLPDLAASSKKRLFEQVGLLFENQHGIARGVVFESLFARERLGSTGLGQGVAIPHGRIKGLKDALGAFVRLSQPVAFDAPDGQPVNPGIRAAGSEHATEKHLEILSELASDVQRTAELREALAGAADPVALHQTITAWQPDAPGRRRASCMRTTASRFRSPGLPGATQTVVRRESAAAAALIGHLQPHASEQRQVIGVYEAGND